MLNAWEAQHPNRITNIFGALRNIEPSHLADTKHFNFLDLKAKDNNDLEALLKKIIKIEKIN